MEAESLYGVSIVHGENLILQTQTAIACDIVKMKLSMVNDLTDTSDQIMLVKELGKIVKNQGLLRSLDLLLRMLEPHRHDDEEVISASSKLQDPQQVPEGLAAIFIDPKCRRWLFEAKRLVNQRVIDVGLVSELESVKKDVRDGVGQRDLHQDEN